MEAFEITDMDIKDQVAYISTYNKGMTYFKRGRIFDFEFDSETLRVNAEVAGANVYTVNINFTSSGTVVSSSCECGAFAMYPGACKHIVAVLKQVQKECREGLQFSMPRNHIDRHRFKSQAAQQIIDFFDNIQEEISKQPVDLEVTYELERGMATGFRSNIELRIGTERLYIVKSMERFIEAVTMQNSLEFGKKFTYDPMIHAFDSHDLDIIKLLQEIYQHEKMLNTWGNTGYGRGDAFSGKKVYLSDLAAQRLLNILENRPFDAIIQGRRINNISIKDETLPLHFEMGQSERGLKLELKEVQHLMPMTSNGSYFLYQDTIYRVPEKQAHYLYPFFYAFSMFKQEEVQFEGEQKERLVSEILPQIKKISEVNIEQSVADKIVNEALEADIYFDEGEKGISARIEFRYGEQMINPFENRSLDIAADSILLRDVEKEKSILSAFEQAEFTVREGQVHQHSEDKIFEFVYHILPKLQAQAEVFYSETFKNMKVRDTKNYTTGVRLNQTSDLLEFSFEHPDIPAEELEDIFTSIQKKKKYYRLKDGSFIPLEDLELQNIAHLIENLGIDYKLLKDSTIQLPKFRAMYIDNALREGKIPKVKRNQAFKQLVQNVSEPQDMDFEVPQSLQSILRDYQKIGFKWFKTIAAYGLGGILADDMGLGKTLQVIAFVLSEKQNEKMPSLVIAPTSLVYNWQDEVQKFVDDSIKTVIISGDKSERKQQFEKVKDADIVITSYPLIRRDIGLYGGQVFKYCFLDEAQHIKNPNTLNAKSVKKIKAQGYYALTGTPIENTLTELWSIFDFIMPGYLFSHSKFIKMYERPIVKDGVPESMDALSKQIKPFILRRMKKDVLKELPDKIESKMTVYMTEQQKKLYLSYVHQMREKVAQEIAQQGFEKSRIKILAMLTRLRQICCHPGLFVENYQGGSGKMDMLAEIIQEAIESGHRILIFSQFTSMLSIIRAYLEKEEIPYFYLDGATKTEQRGERVKAFNRGEGKVFLISLKAGGTGLNLTGADMVIHFDPWWNPAVEDQATDRAHRIGQKNVVQVMKLITQGTIEEKIYHLQHEKKKIIEAVIQPGQTLFTKMTQAQIQELFEVEK